MRNIATAMMIVTLTIASHGQTSKPVSSVKSSQGQPFWRAKVMENEPVLFIRNEGKPFATGKLLFMPSAKPTIMAPDLVMKYEEGKDYVWKPGSNMIELTAGTRIPFKTSAEMVPPPGSPNTLMGVLFAEGYFFHDLQVQVSYPHVDKWPLQDAPVAVLALQVHERSRACPGHAALGSFPHPAGKVAGLVQHHPIPNAVRLAGRGHRAPDVRWLGGWSLRVVEAVVVDHRHRRVAVFMQHGMGGEIFPVGVAFLRAAIRHPQHI